MAFHTEISLERENLEFLRTIQHIGRGRLAIQMATKYNLQITVCDRLLDEMIKKHLISESEDGFISFARHHVVSDLF